MDDDMEDEIIYELFTAHAHILWRYLGVTTAGLIELVIPGPGESVKMKIFQPGPFMFLIFLVIVASVVLQSSSHLLRQWMVRLCCVLGLNSVTDSGLKSFGGIELVTGSIGTDNVLWEFKDGIVGVYSMQGRRGNMEDRFSVIQDEDVGEKKMSFFGVFDGHGGQYTAEFVKDHLFKNTIEKIKQLRSQASIVKNGNNNIPGSSSKNANGNGKSSTAASKVSTPGTTTATSNNVNKKSSSSSTSSSEAENAKKSSTTTPTGKTEEAGAEKTAESGSSSSTSDSEGNNNCQANSVECKAACPGSGVETISQPSSGSISSSSSSSSCPASTSAKPADPEVSSKKDDLYNSVSLKKRNSVSGSSSNGNNSNNNSNSNSASKEKKDDSSSSSSSSSSNSSSSSQSSGYIDSQKNINYTRLLTDQIMAVDKQVVQHCKSRTDMSGTTAVIALLDGELLVIGNVGDSRAVMGDLKGSTIPLSFDHKPNQLKERRRIKEAGGFITFSGVWRVAGILATSRALGDFPLKEPRKLVTAEPDVLTFSLRDHKAHFVILATDGLWDVYSNEEAVAYVRDHIHESDFGAKSLCMSAYYRGSQDNITVAILNIDKLGL